MTRTNALLGGILVLWVGYLVGSGAGPARANVDPLLLGDTDAGRIRPGLTLMTGQLKGSPDTEILYVLREADQKLAIYLVNGPALELRHMRALTEDFDVGEAFSRSGNTQTPTPAEMRALRK
ncbi:MAG: hypothetical protein AB7O52_00055 [Planctomycetota bacterium]